MTTINFEDFARQHATEDEIEPFPYVLPRDITLVPKPFLIDGFVGAAEISARWLARRLDHHRYP
jgi:hypothetical protein